MSRSGNHRYRVLIHRRVSKFIKRDVKGETDKRRLLDVIEGLAEYPAVLRKKNVEKIKGLERTFRIRAGKY